MEPQESEFKRLQAALRWLKSHRHSLQIDRRSLEGQLGRLVAEIERLDREIERAEARLRELPGGRNPQSG